MKISIVRDDGVVGINGNFKKLDLSGLPQQISAVQFDTVTGYGHIEYTGTEPRLPNQDITIEDFDQFQPLVNAWGEVVPTPDNPTPVPQSITRLQGLLVLEAAGYLEAIEVYMASGMASRTTVIAWNNAQFFERVSPTVAFMAGLLGLSDTDVDNLFIAAFEITSV